MAERAIDRLAEKARRARDNRRPKVWHFIKGNWPKFRRWHDHDGVTYRAMAEMLADEPEVQEGGKGPSEFAVRRAYMSVEALMGRNKERDRQGTKAPLMRSSIPPLRSGEVAPGVRPVSPTDTPERSGGGSEPNSEIAGTPTATSASNERSGGRDGLLDTETVPAGGRPAPIQPEYEPPKRKFRKTAYFRGTEEEE